MVGIFETPEKLFGRQHYQSVLGQNVSTGASAECRYFDFYVRKGQDDRL